MSSSEAEEDAPNWGEEKDADNGWREEEDEDSTTTTSVLHYLRPTDTLRMLRCQEEAEVGNEDEDEDLSEDEHEGEDFSEYRLEEEPFL
jgi:hypothetical protein